MRLARGLVPIIGVGLTVALCTLAMSGLRVANPSSLLAFSPGMAVEKSGFQQPASFQVLPARGLDARIAKAEAHAELIREEADLVRQQTLASREEAAFRKHDMEGTEADNELIQRATRLTRLAEQVG